MSPLQESLRRLAAACGELLGARRLLRRQRRRFRLARARDKVVAALADARVRPSVGRALIAHIETLRRDCDRGRGD